MRVVHQLHRHAEPPSLAARDPAALVAGDDGRADASLGGADEGELGQQLVHAPQFVALGHRPR